MIRTGKIIRVAFFIMLISGVFKAYPQEKKQVSISGFIKNNTFSAATLFPVGKEPNHIDTILIGKEGNFTYNLELKVTDIYKLQFDINTFIWLILQPGEKLEIVIDANDFVNKLEIKGSEQSLMVLKNQKMMMDNKTKLDSIKNLSYADMTNPKYDSLSKVYSYEYQKIITNHDQTLTSFILKNPKSLAILFLLEALPVDENIDTYSNIDSILFATYPENIYVNNFHLQITSTKKTAIGALAPDFILPDTNGNNISLSSLRGKYVLIDFWASWCGPCRKEIPNMVKLYQDFGGKNFEILGVSLDKTRDKWVGAIKSDHLNWPQVSDLKFWQSEVTPIYNVKAIPYTVLLDKEGKIIAKNLRGEELYQKIESLLK